MIVSWVLAVGCVTYGQEVRRVESELVGLDSRSLRLCMPVPVASDVDGDIELAVYRWTPDPEDGGGIVDVFDSSEDPPSSRERARDVRDFYLEGEPPEHQAFCQLTFELQDGKIRGVRAEGRDLNGLNANARCLMQARDCLPEVRSRR